MRRLALAIAVTCVLSGAARAGEIPTTGAVAPPPPPGTMTMTGEIHSANAVAPGEIHPTGAPEESTTALTIILTLISIVP